MKKYFMIETKSDRLSKTAVARALRIYLISAVKVTELKSDPHSLASLGNFVKKS